mgnify:CR=1
MNDAFQVWWFMFWRTALTTIGVYIVLNIIKFGMGIGPTDPLSSIFSALSMITAVVAQVFYLKKSFNRDYKGFRLSTTPNSVG